MTTDLLTIYDKLKQAMLELFGGHSQFTLALKEGFSRAFQGLDEVTAVRVSKIYVTVFTTLHHYFNLPTEVLQIILLKKFYLTFCPAVL